jgi:hypothetical protein
MGWVVLQLTKGFLAVKFGADGHGLLFELSAGEQVRVLGSSVIPGCVEIAYEGERFHIFDVDLRSHSGRPAAVGLASAGRRPEWLGHVKGASRCAVNISYPAGNVLV